MYEHDQRILHSSEDPNWRTPRPCFVQLVREFPFQMDLAADAASSLTADQYFGPGSQYGEDALAEAWHLRTGPHFLNPPYSRKLAARLKQEGDPRHRAYRIESWARKCWEESQKGATIVGIFPFAPQTAWYRQYVCGHFIPAGAPVGQEYQWSGHAAREERRLTHRIGFLRADGSPAKDAGVNSVIVVWRPNVGIVGPWQPHTFYWSYR
jgi:hypothetical protein